MSMGVYNFTGSACEKAATGPRSRQRLFCQKSIGRQALFLLPTWNDIRQSRYENQIKFRNSNSRFNQSVRRKLEQVMKIALAIDIFRKPEQVFPWVAEPERAMCWQKGVKGGEILKETPEKVGTTFREEIAENGNSLVMQGEITDYIPDQLISFHLESKIHKVDVSYSIVWNNNRSTFAVKTTIHWKFPINVVSLVMGRKIRGGIVHQTESELAELKRLCEASRPN